MAGAGRKWLVGCGIGCASLVLLLIVALVGGSIVMMRPFNRAVDAQQALDAAHGDREDFVPPAGTFAPERLQAFLRVRKDLMPACAEFERISARFRAVEELDGSDEDVGSAEAVRTVLPVIGAAFGLAGDIGRLTETRNRALLARGMGLGEYVWYYVLVYNSWLGNAPNQDFADEEGGGAYSAGERRVIAALLAGHAESLRAAGRGGEAGPWAAEAEAVLDSETGVPFGPGGLPAAYAATLEPWRARLESVYCPVTSSFELGTIRKKGLSIHSE